MSAPDLQGFEAPLAAYLCGAWDADHVAMTSSRRLSGGAIQENWLLEVEVRGGPQENRRQVVLRTDAPTPVGTSLSRADEYVILCAAHEAGVRVAEPLGLCTDPAVLGRPFFLMQAVPGTATGSRVVKGRQLAADRDGLVRELARELVKIHGIDPDDGLLAVIGARPRDAVADLVAAYRRDLDDAARPSPTVEFALRWLERHAPREPATAFCHRDFRTGNYMVDASGLTAILDWEFAGWSCPIEDLGWFCSKTWRFGAAALEAGGIAPRATFLAAYQDAGGRTVTEEELFFWELMANVRWAVIAHQQTDRLLKFGERSLEMALIGRRIHETEMEIIRMLGLPMGRAA
jgi:aminoglycoside phosphotransferase (APT) family kinase protein